MATIRPDCRLSSVSVSVLLRPIVSMVEPVAVHPAIIGCLYIFGGSTQIDLIQVSGNRQYGHSTKVIVFSIRWYQV